MGSCGTSGNAWRSSSEDMGEQWLELTYAEEMEIGYVGILESYNPGFVTRIEGYDDLDQPVTIWSGTDDASCGGYLVAVIDPPFTTDRIRIYCDTDVPGWNEIDAVELIGVSE